jgi:hypothetical protein
MVTANNAEEAYLKADKAEFDETTLDRLGLTFVDRQTVSESQAI